MDLLDDIFSALRLRGALYFRTDFSGQWGVTVPDLRGAARFHLVIRGLCHVRLASGEAITLTPGDLILIPAGQRHELTDAEGRDAPPLETVLHALNYDGSCVLVAGAGDADASTQMACGHFTFRTGADHPLLRALPGHIVVTAADRESRPFLDEILRLLSQKIFEDLPGSPASVLKLSEAAFIEIIKTHPDEESELAKVVSAFNDRHLSKALICIHENSDHPWTVQTLAKHAGMSRSRFADRFRSLLGVTPLAYLSNWRLQTALSSLEDTDDPIQQISLKAGYRSPAAFTRAFAARFGSTPSEHRLRARNFAARPSDDAASLEHASQD